MKKVCYNAHINISLYGDKMKEKNKILILILLIIIIIDYFICSYLGLFFFTDGIGAIDLVLLEIIGNSLVVGIVTYFSTKFISEYLQEKEFNRNNTIEIEHEKTPYKIVNYEMFLDMYIKNLVIFEMDEKNKEVIEKVFQKYLEWDSIIKNGNKDYKKEITFINLPFITSLLKTQINFYDMWKELYDKRVAKKENIFTLSDEDFNLFAQFVKILSNLRFYNLRNLSKSNIARGIILGDNKVISKFSLFPNQNNILGYFYEMDLNIEILVFYHDYRGKEKCENIMGFKYQMKDNHIPANIDLDSLMK